MNDYYMSGIKTALVSYGAMLESWKLTWIETEQIGNTDFYMVTVTITKARCRKPFMIWNLKIDAVRELVHFDQSSFEYL